MIIAVEPFDYNYELLEHNIVENGIKNVETKKIAVSNYDGEATLVIGKSSLAPSIQGIGDGESVGVTTLDKMIKPFCLARVDLVKINAEGAELEILQGMSWVIERYSPDFVITPNHYPGEGELVSKYLQSKGYRITEKNGVLFGEKDDE